MSAHLGVSVTSTFAAMKNARRFLIWQGVQRPGKAKPDKVPFYTNGTHRGTTDSPDDTALLDTYDAAVAAAASRGAGWAIGFALGDGWQGIDLDDLDANGLAELVPMLPGYVEVSPSGKGVHAIGYGRMFPTLGPNGSGIEAYFKGRFFTFTEKTIRDGAVACLADHAETVLAPRHKARPRSPLKGSQKPAFLQVSAQILIELRSALFQLRADNRDLWIKMGLALTGLGEIGRGLWMAWSATSEKFDPLDAARTWDSFGPTQIDYRAVLGEAHRVGWINTSSNEVVFADFANKPSLAPMTAIVANVFTAPECFDIPPRPWVFGRWFLRGTVATVIAPGGTGKSALMVAVALSLVTGRQFIGKTVGGGPLRAWLWNLEDDQDELTRQFVACCLHHGISERDYEGRLFVNDASRPLCIAAKDREGLIIDESAVSALIAQIRANEIDVFVVDPLVSSHRAEENDNGQIDAIAKLWVRIAREGHCSVVLVHHSRKLGGQQADAESARGASALGNAARSVLVLNRMEKGEASQFGISESDRRNYIRVSNDKSNRAPAGQADWFRFVSVWLANAPDGGDSIGVLESWTPPDATMAVEHFDDSLRAKIQGQITSGKWRADPLAAQWVGCVVAKAIGANLANPVEKHRVKALLADMLAKGQICTVRGKDASRKPRNFIIAGEVIAESCDSPGG